MTRTILLVDDSKTMREVLKVYLMGRKFEFLEAPGAERALHLLRLLPICLVIVDFNMPKMDGVTFLLRMRESKLPMARVPVIMVTADKNVDTQARALAAGADAFLQKPLDSKRVVEVVERFLPQK